MQTRSRTVEIPNGLSLPLAFGMFTRLIGSGRYVSCLSARASFPEPARLAVRLDSHEVLSVHAWRALVGAALGIGAGQDVLAANLVVQRVEAIVGFCLRFRVQRPLQLLDTVWS